MPIIAALANRRAMKRYQSFLDAMGNLGDMLDDADRVIAQMADMYVGASGWKVPDKREVIAARNRVTRKLELLRRAAKRYEAELISNEWKV
jgi:hypothetical protein